MLRKSKFAVTISVLYILLIMVRHIVKWDAQNEFISKRNLLILLDILNKLLRIIIAV